MGNYMLLGNCQYFDAFWGDNKTAPVDCSETINLSFLVIINQAGSVMLAVADIFNLVFLSTIEVNQQLLDMNNNGILLFLWHLCCVHHVLTIN